MPGNMLTSNKASGLDNISARLLKEASPIVTRSLTFQDNKSLNYHWYISSKCLETS